MFLLLFPLLMFSSSSSSSSSSSLGVKANSCPTNRSSWDCVMQSKVFVSWNFVHHAPNMLVFLIMHPKCLFSHGFYASCTQIFVSLGLHGCTHAFVDVAHTIFHTSCWPWGFLWALCKHLATPHANWSTCNFPKINLSKIKTVTVTAIKYEIPVRKYKTCKHFCAKSTLNLRGWVWHARRSQGGVTKRSRTMQRAGMDGIVRDAHAKGAIPLLWTKTLLTSDHFQNNRSNSVHIQGSVSHGFQTVVRDCRLSKG